MDKELVGIVGEKYGIVGEVLDERGRRLWAAAEAKYLPHGGVSIVSKATGMSRTTIHAGMKELEAEERQLIPCGPKPQAGRRPQVAHGFGARHHGGAGQIGRAHHAGRSRVPIAMDVQRVPGCWRRSCNGRVIRSGIGRSRTCYTRCATAFRRTRKRWRASSIQTATLNSNTSIIRRKVFCVGISR